MAYERHFYVERPRWLYYLLDDAGEVVYIGVTSRPAQRIYYHNRRPLYSGIEKADKIITHVRWRYLGVMAMPEALAIEHEEIVRLTPPANLAKLPLGKKGERRWKSRRAERSWARGSPPGVRPEA